MTLKEYVDDFYQRSESASKVFRQLAFAAFAIVWLFKHEDKTNGIFYIPIEYKPALLFFVLSLTADLLHYFIPSVIHGFRTLWLQVVKGKKVTEQIKVHILYTVPTWLFFMAKMVLLAIGYFKLLFVMLNSFR